MEPLVVEENVVMVVQPIQEVVNEDLNLIIKESSNPTDFFITGSNGIVSESIITSSVEPEIIFDNTVHKTHVDVAFGEMTDYHKRLFKK